METQHGRFQNISVQKRFHFFSVPSVSFWAPPPGSVIISTHQAKKVRKLFCDFFTTSKTDVHMNLQKAIPMQRNLGKNLFFVGILKANEKGKNPPKCYGSTTLIF